MLARKITSVMMTIRVRISKLRIMNSLESYIHSQQRRSVFKHSSNANRRLVWNIISFLIHTVLPPSNSKVLRRVRGKILASTIHSDSGYTAIKVIPPSSYNSRQMFALDTEVPFTVRILSSTNHNRKKMSISLKTSPTTMNTPCRLTLKVGN